MINKDKINEFLTKWFGSHMRGFIDPVEDMPTFILESREFGDDFVNFAINSLHTKMCSPGLLFIDDFMCDYENHMKSKVEKPKLPNETGERFSYILSLLEKYFGGFLDNEISEGWKLMAEASAFGDRRLVGFLDIITNKRADGFPRSIRNDFRSLTNISKEYQRVFDRVQNTSKPFTHVDAMNFLKKHFGHDLNNCREDFFYIIDEAEKSYGKKFVDFIRYIVVADCSGAFIGCYYRGEEVFKRTFLDMME